MTNWWLVSSEGQGSPLGAFDVEENRHGATNHELELFSRYSLELSLHFEGLLAFLLRGGV